MATNALRDMKMQIQTIAPMTIVERIRQLV